MSRMLHLALHDTRLFVLARESLFFMFIMPVMFMLFFSSVLGGRGDPRQVKVSLPVIDEDGGWLARSFVRQLAGERFEVTVMSPAEAETTTLIRSVRIPAGFTENLLAGRQVSLAVRKSATGNIQYDAAAEVRLHLAQVAFLGNLIRWDALRGARDGADGGFPVADADRALLDTLIDEPPSVTVQSGFAGRGRPVPSGANQSIPGMLAMFVVMSVLIGGAESLTRERHAGTLARLGTTPFSRGEILGGKLLHLTLTGLIQALVLMAAGQAIGATGLFGIEFSWGPRWPLLLLLLVPYAVAVACLTLWIGGLFHTTQQAESLGWLLGMVMAALGGCWWPNEIMPAAVRAIARGVPTSWAMEGLHAVITFGRGVEGLAAPALVLLGFAALFGWLGARTLKLS